MRYAILLFVLTGIFTSCSTKQDEQQVSGVWFTYAESGDYMELWLGEDKAMSYLSSIDQFLLYELERDGSRMNFSLIESSFVDEHEFSLEVTKASDKLFQATFSSDNKTDPKKTYFLIDKEVPDLKATLAANKSNMEMLFARLESGSHEGHDH